MSLAASFLLVPLIVAAPPDEIEPNTPSSVVRPATAVAPSPGRLAMDPKETAAPSDSQTQAGRKQADSISAPDHTPMAISSRRSKPAESTASGDDAHQHSAAAMTWWTTTGLGLAAVLGVLFVGSRLIRRVVPGGFVGETAGPVHLLCRTYLTPKHSVCLVKCGERILLVGISGERMQTLSEIHDPEEIDYLRGQLMQVRPRSASQAFRDAVTGPARSASYSDPSGAQEKAASPTFADRLSVLRERISEWKSKAKAT